MKRSLLLLLCLCLLASAADAGELQASIKSRWLGAWVVTKVDVRSDCGPNFTNNRINGALVKSRGAHPFDVGELAQLNKVDLNRSRLDVMLTLPEPILVPWTDGPFTLYRELSCKVELEVEVPRQAVKDKNLTAVEAALLAIVERHTSQSDAAASELWNARERAPYPDDYEITLNRHAIWNAEQENAAIQAQLDFAKAETERTVERVNSDADYIAGFASGVEKARTDDLQSCSRLMAISLDVPEKSSSEDEETPEEARNRRGYHDGRNFVYGLEITRRLPECFVEVPQEIAGS